MSLQNIGKKHMNKTTVIGGSGFVGTFLLNELNELNELNVRNLDKVQSPFFESITKIGNIQNLEDIIFEPNQSSVVLLAAEHRDDISPNSFYYDVNVEGTRNVLLKMDAAGIKHLIFTSSVAVYGLNKNNPDENHPHDPFNHYGKSKWMAEQVITKWYKNAPDGKSVTIIRPAVIFGERNRGNVFNLLKQISSGKFMMIGKGQNKKSMAYVGNVVALIKDKLEKPEPGLHIFNYADKPDFSMTELVQVIESKMDIRIYGFKIPYWIGMLGGYGFDLLGIVARRKLDVSSVRVQKFCATTQFNATKVHSNFKAPYTLKEGLDLTLDHEFINPKEDDVLFYTE